jgi:hypothetical protein
MTTPITLRGRGAGVEFTVTHIPVPDLCTKNITEVSFKLSTPERIMEFHHVLTRAMNCMDNPPEWAVDYTDFLTGTPSPVKRRDEPKEPTDGAVAGDAAMVSANDTQGK